jgi:hypothetical protein
VKLSSIQSLKESARSAVVLTSAPIVLKTVKYLGCASADGKMGGVSILAFESNEDREKYRKAWNNNTGMNKGKSCHLSQSNTAMTGMKFRQIGENFGNENAKGKK